MIEPARALEVLAGAVGEATGDAGLLLVADSPEANGRATVVIAAPPT